MDKPIWAKWIAQDYYGDWHYFRWKPSAGDSCATWNTNKSFWRIVRKFGGAITTTNYKNEEILDNNGKCIPIKKHAYTGGYNDHWKLTLRRLTKND